jgi:hypothetical protein
MVPDRGRCITHRGYVLKQGRVSGLGVEDWAHPYRCRGLADVTYLEAAWAR